jgi:hypothetical protein
MLTTATKSYPAIQCDKCGTFLRNKKTNEIADVSNINTYDHQAMFDRNETGWKQIQGKHYLCPDCIYAICGEQINKIKAFPATTLEIADKQIAEINKLNSVPF